MVNGTFFYKLIAKNKIKLPSEVVNELMLEEGDQVEIHIKKIKTKRGNFKISQNPLAKLLDL